MSETPCQRIWKPFSPRNSTSAWRCSNWLGMKVIKVSTFTISFLEDVLGEPVSPDRVVATVLSPDEIDTIVVPAKEEGFQETFLGEHRWYAVRIHGSVRPQIKYIAAYQIAPVQ